MKAPTVVVNFKVYQEAEGDRAFRLAKTCQKVSMETGISVAVCPPHLWLGAIARVLEIPTYSQSVDPLPPGAGTGFITPSMLHSTDVTGTLINHSEHRIPRDQIAKAVEMCNALKLQTCVCAEDATEAADLATFSPSAIAVEPPGLIGGNVSVTTADPSIVSDTVEAVKRANPSVVVYCGAGVKTGEDVKAAIDLGATGVLLASGVVKAKDPEEVLRDLVSMI